MFPCMVAAHHHGVRLECGMLLDLNVCLKQQLQCTSPEQRLTCAHICVLVVLARLLYALLVLARI